MLLLESLAVNEIARLLSATRSRITMFHCWDHQKRENDLVMERSDGALTTVEIKATRSPTSGHLRHVRWLRDKTDRAAPGTFRAGVLLHTGPQSLTVEDRLHLRPLNVLWTTPR